MVDYREVSSKIIVWCEGDDRYVRVHKREGVVVGLNYIQGDDFSNFVENCNFDDLVLTKFYTAVHPGLSGETELDRINQAIWAYFSYYND